MPCVYVLGVNWVAVGVAVDDELRFVELVVVACTFAA